MVRGLGFLGIPYVLTLYFEIDKTICAESRCDRRKEFGSGITFSNISLCPGPQNGLDYIFIAVLAYEDYFNAGDGITYLACSVYSVQFRKAEVQQNQIRFQCLSFLNCLKPIYGLAHD